MVPSATATLPGYRRTPEPLTGLVSAGKCRGSSLARGRDRALDEWRDRFDRELAGVCPRDVPARIDRDECRPRVDGISAPDAELPIVQNRMRRTESERRLTNALGDALGDVLAAVDADDGDVIGVFLFELPQLRKYVDAVDSAVGPEIEEEQLAAEVGEREPASPSVDPVERCWKVWRADGRAVDFGHIVLNTIRQCG